MVERPEFRHDILMGLGDEDLHALAQGLRAASDLIARISRPD